MDDIVNSVNDLEPGTCVICCRTTDSSKLLVSSSNLYVEKPALHCG